MEFTLVPVTPFRQNCSVLRCGETGAGAIVDPGGDVDRILAAAGGVRIEKILVTHGHVDHAGATAVLAALLDVPIEGPHPDDRFLIDALARQGERLGLAGAAPFVPDRWLGDGDVVELGALRLEVYHCPGHTPGHVTFFDRRGGIAVVGDVLFAGSVGRTDLPRGSHEDLVRSIRGKLFPLGDEVTFIPGHGQTSTFGWERKCNPYVADLMFE
jgi:glyoxylase-like metal-dependent hydrolase (beta-lactamase superfamily II)